MENDGQDDDDDEEEDPLQDDQQIKLLTDFFKVDDGLNRHLNALDQEHEDSLSGEDLPLIRPGAVGSLELESGKPTIDKSSMLYREIESAIATEKDKLISEMKAELEADLASEPLEVSLTEDVEDDLRTEANTEIEKIRKENLDLEMNWEETKEIFGERLAVAERGGDADEEENDGDEEGDPDDFDYDDIPIVPPESLNHNIPWRPTLDFPDTELGKLVPNTAQEKFHYSK